MRRKPLRRSAARLEWQRVTERRFAVCHFDEADFVGCTTLLCIDQVREPLWLSAGRQRICVADAGYMWLQQFPTGAHHAITSQFDADGNIVQWYIDICKAHSVDEDGVPWWDDLYLDIVVSPGGKPTLLDEDELDDAVQSGIISASDAALAHAEAQKLIGQIESGKIDLVKRSTTCRETMLKLVESLS